MIYKFFRLVARGMRAEGSMTSGIKSFETRRHRWGDLRWSETGKT
jgi:hypothetical protein